MSVLEYTYNEIHNIVKHKSEYILDKFNPQIIIAISDGGLIPARILRTYINIPIYTVSVKYYKENNIMDTPQIIHWIHHNFSNKRVLIVDEIDDTGSTIHFCKNNLANINKCTNIGAFVVHYKQKEKFFENDNNDNYFVGQYVPDKWILYPWDKA